MTPGWYPPQQPPPRKGPSGCLVAAIVSGLAVVSLSGLMCVAIIVGKRSSGPTPSSAEAVPAPPSASASAATAPRPPSTRPLYELVAQLAKAPESEPRASQAEEQFQGVAYMRYDYDRPADMPVAHVEMRIRRATPGAWMFIVRPGFDEGLITSAFAPAGGLSLIGPTDPSGNTAEQAAKAAALEYSITKGPLAGGVLFVRGDSTITVKSHAEAYAKR